MKRNTRVTAEAMSKFSEKLGLNHISSKKVRQLMNQKVQATAEAMAKFFTKLGLSHNWPDNSAT